MAKEVKQQSDTEKPRIHLPVLYTVERHVLCPYQGSYVAASNCFRNQRNATHPFCYECPDGAIFEHRFGSRTYQKCALTNPPPERKYLDVRVSCDEKKHGIRYTYARLNKDGKLTYPFYELVDWNVPYLGSTEMARHRKFTGEELARLKATAARERLRMRGGGSTSKRGGKARMIGQEMKDLIADKKRRDALSSNPNWYRNVKVDKKKDAAAVKAGEEAALKLGYGGKGAPNLGTFNTGKTISFSKARKKKPVAKVQNMQSVLSANFKMMTSLKKKK